MDVKRVIEIAHGELGYRETGVNIQKYSPAVPGLEWSQGQPWCATFTCWVFLQAGGKPNEDFPLTASCLQQVAWGRSRGRFYSTPKVGDLAMYGPNGGTHVEIVVAVSGDTVTTIGGNTSGSWGGNYWNGDGVYKKTRPASAAYGYVRPVYSSSVGDDMPEFVWFTRNEEMILEPGKWTTVQFTRTSGKTGNYRDVVKGPAHYVLSASVVLEGKALPEGCEVQMRVSHYRRDAYTLPTGVYRQGATGPAVRQIQEALIALGYSVGPDGADGVWGPRTTAGLVACQHVLGIDADGVYGPQTRAAMSARLPTSVTQTMAGPIHTTRHGGGDHHMTYAIAERLSKSHVARVRVVHYGPTPVPLLSAKATSQVWEA